MTENFFLPRTWRGAAWAWHAIAHGWRWAYAHPEGGVALRSALVLALLVGLLAPLARHGAEATPRAAPRLVVEVPDKVPAPSWPVPPVKDGTRLPEAPATLAALLPEVPVRAVPTVRIVPPQQAALPAEVRAEPPAKAEPPRESAPARVRRPVMAQAEPTPAPRRAQRPGQRGSRLARAPACDAACVRNRERDHLLAARESSN